MTICMHVCVPVCVGLRVGDSPASGCGGCHKGVLHCLEQLDTSNGTAGMPGLASSMGMKMSYAVHNYEEQAYESQ